MFDLVIRGGSVVTPDGTIAMDIAVEDRRVVALATEPGDARESINACGLTVFPALIDIHLHFNDPGRTEWEGAATGSRALAAGGGTLFFDMPLNSSPCTVGGAEFDAKRRALEQSSITDFALWGGLIPGNRASLGDLAACGVVGFKAFLCNSGLAEFARADDLTLYEGMTEAARLGLPVAVHAESEEITSGLTRRMLDGGRDDIAAFLESRPVIAEIEAIERACVMARETGCKLHIVHISTGRGVAAALEGRARGADVSIETCPHYLLFTADDLTRIGAIAKCAPPLRGSADRDALWSRVIDGGVDAIASDHSPCPAEMKQRASFFDVWGGIAGVQWTLPALIEHGYHERGLALDRIAAMTAGNGARRFRIAGRGAIEIGNRADFALVDIESKQRVEEENMHQRHRISAYAGCGLRGVVKRTLRNGETIFLNGEFMARTHGKLVRPCIGKECNAPSGIHT